jgi:hypothetical protein
MPDRGRGGKEAQEVSYPLCPQAGLTFKKADSEKLNASPRIAYMIPNSDLKFSIGDSIEWPTSINTFEGCKADHYRREACGRRQSRVSRRHNAGDRVSGQRV